MGQWRIGMARLPLHQARRGDLFGRKFTPPVAAPASWRGGFFSQWIAPAVILHTVIVYGYSIRLWSGASILGLAFCFGENYVSVSFLGLAFCFGENYMWVSRFGARSFVLWKIMCGYHEPPAARAGDGARQGTGRGFVSGMVKIPNLSWAGKKKKIDFRITNDCLFEKRSNVMNVPRQYNNNNSTATSYTQSKALRVT